MSNRSGQPLESYPWPGNVRELENLVSRAVVLATGTILQPSDLGFGLEAAPSAVNLKFAKKAIELDFIKKALSQKKFIEHFELAGYKVTAGADGAVHGISFVTFKLKDNSLADFK